MMIGDALGDDGPGGIIEGSDLCSFRTGKEKLTVLWFLGAWSGDQFIVLRNEAEDAAGMTNCSGGKAGGEIVEEGRGATLGSNESIDGGEKRALKGDPADFLAESPFTSSRVEGDEPARLPGCQGSGVIECVVGIKGSGPDWPQ